MKKDLVFLDLWTQTIETLKKRDRTVRVTNIQKEKAEKDDRMIVHT